MSILDMMNEKEEKPQVIQLKKDHQAKQEISATSEVSTDEQTEEKEVSFRQYREEIKQIKESIIENHADVLKKNISLPEVKEELRTILERLVMDVLKKYKLSEMRRTQIITYLLQDLSEYKAITDLYHTEGVTDIHIKNHSKITYRKNGVLHESSLQFASKEDVLELAHKFLRETDTTSTREITWKTPIENTKLLDGSRVNIMIDPVSLKGPTISIRKHRQKFFTLQQLIENGTLTAEVAHYMKRCVEGRVNTLIIGGGGTGKTEIARLCGSFIPKGLNVDTIEDTEELQLDKIHPNVRPLEFRKELKDGMKGSASDILRWGSQRSDIDVVVVGEILDNETFWLLLDTMSIGQPGSMSTLHSDTAELGVDRGISMCAAAAPNLSEKFFIRRIANSIDQIITVKRYYQDGSRRINRITQVNGYKDDQVLLEDIFRYQSDKGHYRTQHPVNQRIQEKLIDNGVPLDFNVEGKSE
jgi:pilus assembly protein CpaF